MDILDEPVPYPEEVETFDVNGNRDKYRIVTLGDSTTLCRRQDKGQRWPDLLQTECSPTCIVVNSGLDGTSSSLALFRWHRDVTPIKPDCVVISFLLNDNAIRFYDCRTSSVVQCTQDRMDANLRAQIDLTRSSGAAPVPWTLPSVPEWLWPDVHKGRRSSESKTICSGAMLKRSSEQPSYATFRSSIYGRHFLILSKTIPALISTRPTATTATSTRSRSSQGRWPRQSFLSSETDRPKRFLPQQKGKLLYLFFA